MNKSFSNEYVYHIDPVNFSLTEYVNGTASISDNKMPVFNLQFIANDTLYTVLGHRCMYIKYYKKV